MKSRGVREIRPSGWMRTSSRVPPLHCIRLAHLAVGRRTTVPLLSGRHESRPWDGGCGREAVGGRPWERGRGREAVAATRKGWRGVDAAVSVSMAGQGWRKGSMREKKDTVDGRDVKRPRDWSMGSGGMTSGGVPLARARDHVWRSPSRLGSLFCGRTRVAPTREADGGQQAGPEAPRLAVVAHRVGRRGGAGGRRQVRATRRGLVTSCWPWRLRWCAGGPASRAVWLPVSTGAERQALRCDDVGGSPGHRDASGAGSIADRSTRPGRRRCAQGDSGFVRRWRGRIRYRDDDGVGTPHLPS